MDLTFLGGASEVGASSTLLSIAGHRLLIDAGIRPAARAGQSRLPDLAPLSTMPPQAILVTHAHIDHTGALPLVASLLPGIPIYATESTRVLAEILLRDSVKIMQAEGLKPDGETPLYDEAQVDAFLGRITPIGFHQPLTLAPGLTVRFLPAGHILGAAMLLFETPEGTLLHTGDVSVTDLRTIKGLDLANLPQADVLICEGTYGNRRLPNRREQERQLVQTVQATLARGGRVLCPAFAVGRAQELVLILKAYRASGQLSPVPIYLDGMTRAVCTAYQQQSHDLVKSLQRYQTNARRPLFADPDLHIFAVQHRQRASLLGRVAPMIVISSSGMLSGGASPLYAAAFAGREEDAIIFSGYQDEESPGAALLTTRQGDTVRLGDQTLTLSCQVSRYSLSGHADAEQLVQVINRVQPRHLVLVHGASDALSALASRFPSIPVQIPTVGETLTVSPAASHAPKASPAQPTPEARDGVIPAPPTLEQLWALARQRGPARPWTAVELGQHYYGPAYRPTMRPQVEQVLKEASPFFKIGQVGAQPTYQPRSVQETEQLRPLTTLSAGEIVLVQSHQQQGTPQIGLILAAPHEGTVRLIGDQWKAAMRPLQTIRLLAGVRRAEWLTLPEQEVKQRLQAWRARLDDLWIDLFAWWQHCQGKPFTFEEVCARCSTEDERLAWGLELLRHGHGLFRREGMTWTPLSEQQVRSDAGFAHHLDLLEAGAGTRVWINERAAILTGRSSWRVFEVAWQDREEVGTPVRVRAATIQLKEGI